MARLDLDNEEVLVKLLADLYYAQKHILFQEMVIEKFMERVGLSEEETIAVLKKMVENKWLVTHGFKPKFFLRPGFVSSFPVVVSKTGLKLLKTED
ncbi:hypothetical protein [Desulfofalx alkaliphila]|uniref:hypothetical protein n=1 Tax=Desulfofalx alkaliphila TaxID=105483 RepID=UPI0004E156D5|nr:hypothetical protein [Desulfofalx alkaliphila]